MHEFLVQLLWLALEILFSGGIDLSVGHPQQRRDEAWGRGAQLTIAGLLAVVVGLISSLAVHRRVLPSPSRPGLSLILLPLVLAAVMHWWGEATGSVKRAKPSYLATWYGGAVMGIGLAAGRLLGLTSF